MAHVRAQIRAYIKNLLSGETGAGADVFAQRVLPVGKDKNAFCNVYLPDETSSAISMEPVRLQRSASLKIIGVFKSSPETIDDILDGFSVDVEKLMAVDRKFSGLVHESGLTSTRLTYDIEGEQVAGQITLDYLAVYHTRDTDPEIST